MNKINNILCPIDFSKSSNEIAEFAAQIAQANQASLHLLNVLPQINYYYLGAGDVNIMSVYPNIANEMMDKQKRESEKSMHKIVADLQAQNPKLKLHSIIDVPDILEGDVTDRIEHYTKKLKVNLIVLGSHGRKGIDRLLMGSVAESIMRNSPCDVMIYKKASKT
jgi:universal stress protein A